MESLWTVTELSAYLGYRAATVRTLLSRAPEKLPPRVAALSLPRWDAAMVRDWAVQQSRPEVRAGRPRLGRPRLAR